MKHLILSLFFLFSLNLLAQADSSRKTEIYLQFKTKKTPLSTKLTISIDFGQKYLAEDSLTRMTMVSQVESFRTMENVLEYLNSNGWKLTTAYSSSYEYFYTYYFVMRKEK